MLKKFFTFLFFIIFIFWYWIYNDLSLIEKPYFSVNFFDIKLWDWVLIKTPEDKIILIDWWNWDEMISKISKKMWFFEKKIDYIFLSHWDSDHISGLISIIKKFQVGKIFLTQQDKKSPYFKKFLEILEEKNISYEFFEDVISEKKSSKIESEENFSKLKHAVALENNFIFKPIFPNLSETEIFWNKSNFSSVFELEIWDLSKWWKKFLFTWDIEKNIENYLVENWKISDVDYLKVAHHWSKTSSQTGFILASQPEFWIICADDENRFWHPKKEIVDRLENFWVQILQTGKIWDIEILIPAN